MPELLDFWTSSDYIGRRSGGLPVRQHYYAEKPAVIGFLAAHWMRDARMCRLSAMRPSAKATWPPPARAGQKVARDFVHLGFEIRVFEHMGE
jgi:hypothetical protein